MATQSRRIAYGRLPGPKTPGCGTRRRRCPRRSRTRRGCRRDRAARRRWSSDPAGGRHALLGQRRRARSGTTEWSAYSDVAVAVGGGGVHPRHAGRRVLAAEQVADVGGLAHVEERVDGAQVLGVGVADRPDARRRPRHQQRGGVDDVALVRCGRGPRATVPSEPSLRAHRHRHRRGARARCGPASVRYVVVPPSEGYSYGVKRYAVDTVWLQATSLFQPMLTDRRADQRGAGDVVLARGS